MSAPASSNCCNQNSQLSQSSNWSHLAQSQGTSQSQSPGPLATNQGASLSQSQSQPQPQNSAGPTSPSYRRAQSVPFLGHSAGINYSRVISPRMPSLSPVPTDTGRRAHPLFSLVIMDQDDIDLNSAWSDAGNQQEEQNRETVLSQESNISQISDESGKFGGFQCSPGKPLDIWYRAQTLGNIGVKMCVQFLRYDGQDYLSAGSRYQPAKCCFDAFTGNRSLLNDLKVKHVIEIAMDQHKVVNQVIYVLDFEFWSNEPFPHRMV